MIVVALVTGDLALRPEGLIDIAISIDDNDVVLPAIPPALLAELGRRLVEATSSEVMAVGRRRGDQQRLDVALAHQPFERFPRHAGEMVLLQIVPIGRSTALRPGPMLE